MKLKQLLKGIEAGEVKGSKEIEITGIASDSRTVAPGNLFLAKKGDTHDGTQFIPQALSAGAAAIGDQREDDDELPDQTPSRWTRPPCRTDGNR